MQAPDNSAYMYAAYTIVCVVYFGYVLILWRRTSATRRRIEGRK